MKQTIFLALLVLLTAVGQSQNIDSLLAIPQTIELTVSTPQPRLGEAFQISIDANALKANIFKSLIGQVGLSNELNGSNDHALTMNVNAVKIGENEIGPLEFYIDKTKYTTNKITYEVIDPLPETDNGLWFRKVMTGH